MPQCQPLDLDEHDSAVMELEEDCRQPVPPSALRPDHSLCLHESQANAVKRGAASSRRPPFIAEKDTASAAYIR